MITGAHVLLYADDAEKARNFFRDVLAFGHVNAGEGWLIFALPPAELGVHPAMPNDPRAANGVVEHYLMCDDVEQTIADLKARGVTILRPVADQGWGLVTAIDVPGMGPMGLYQPRHPTAHGAYPAPAQRKPKPKRKPKPTARPKAKRAKASPKPKSPASKKRPAAKARRPRR